MNKVTSMDLQGYKFDSCKQNKDIKDCIKGFDERLSNEIEKLKARLNELIEVSEVKENIVYFLKNTNSEYNYIDQNMNIYEYQIINNKPLLISKDFKMFEIIEYCDVSSFRSRDKYSGRGWNIESFVDKVCVVKKV